MTSFPSVALVGKQGAGKTTIAKLMVEKYQFLRHSWADPVRSIFSMAYETITPENYTSIKGKLYPTAVETNGKVETVLRTGGELLQRIGTDALRDQVDQDFWIKAGLRRIFRDQMVNDDTRFINEAEALRNRGWVVVRIAAPDDLRKQRLGQGFRPEHRSETEQARIAEDFVLTNDGRDEPLVVLEELMKYLRTVDNSFIAKAQRAVEDTVI